MAAIPPELSPLSLPLSTSRLPSLGNIVGVCDEAIPVVAGLVILLMVRVFGALGSRIEVVAVGMNESALRP